MEIEVMSIVLTERVTASDGQVYVRVDSDEEGIRWHPTLGDGAYTCADHLDDDETLEIEYQESRFGHWEKLHDQLRPDDQF
jgi:hypothetical protein